MLSVQPLVDLMRELIVQSLVLDVDETPVRMLSLGAGPLRGRLPFPEPL